MARNIRDQHAPYPQLGGICACKGMICLRWLQEWCRENQAECLAVQPPGRNLRLKEQPITSCREMAAALMPVVASRLSATPYVVRTLPVHCLSFLPFWDTA